MSHDLFADSEDNWEDREASKKNDGKFANRIYVQPLGNGMVRVNFGEVLDEFPSYHTAIVMTAANAVEFAGLMQNVGAAVMDVDRAELDEVLRQVREDTLAEAKAANAAAKS